MTVHRVGPAYAAVLAALHGAAFPREAWGAGAFQVQLEMHGVIGLLDGRGGLALLRVTADEAEILTIGVMPAARRQGIARALLADAISRVRAIGVRTLFLEVGVRNRAALALYDAAGFKEVGRRRGYYASGEDALILRATIDRADEGGDEAEDGPAENGASADDAEAAPGRLASG
jgi:ribosomal-protein-alanine N-acetyltransferase